MSSTTPSVAGNWKMHKTAEEAAAFLRGAAAGSRPLTGVDVAVFPPFPALAAAAERAAGRPPSGSPPRTCTRPTTAPSPARSGAVCC